MDGTLSGYYYHASKQGAKQTKWVLTLQGGGECVSSKCATKVGTALGSSKYFPKTYTFWNEAKTHLADTSCTGNPDLCDYHQVFLPYCSQDLWTGQANTTSPAGSPAPGYYFSGHIIFGAVLDELATNHGMNAATTIVLSGESAGGFGVYANADYLSARFPAAKVVGAPIAGYEFWAWPYKGPGHTSSSLADFRQVAMASGAYNKLWKAFVPAKCAAAHADDPGSCLLPCFSYTYIDTPLFIMEAQADSVVLMYHDWVPTIKRRSDLTAPITEYMAAFAANQSQCLASAMSPSSKDGVFNPSCFIHTAFQNNFTIPTSSDPGAKRIGYLEAFRLWLGGASVKLADHCPPGQAVCNPTCRL